MNLDDAAKKAIAGETVRFFDMPGGPKHQFHIKPVSLSREGEALHASGWISHHLRWRPDDQINYDIRKDGDHVTDVDINIQRGGLGRLINDFKDIIPLPIADGMGKLIDGKWEGECAQIILAIAKKL
jgi:hypothetical protein